MDVCISSISWSPSRALVNVCFVTIDPLSAVGVKQAALPPYQRNASTLAYWGGVQCPRVGSTHELIWYMGKHIMLNLVHFRAFWLGACLECMNNERIYKSCLYVLTCMATGCLFVRDPYVHGSYRSHNVSHGAVHTLLMLATWRIDR